jgi:hypothetical protein
MHGVNTDSVRVDWLVSLLERYDQSDQYRKFWKRSRSVTRHVTTAVVHDEQWFCHRCHQQSVMANMIRQLYWYFTCRHLSEMGDDSTVGGGSKAQQATASKTCVSMTFGN